MVTEAPRRRPGRPTWQETVERANAREALRAAEAKGGRPKKEDRREAAPLFIPAGSIGCLLCPWYGSPGDLFQHAEEQHGATGIINKHPVVPHSGHRVKNAARQRRYEERQKLLPTWWP